MRLDHPAMYVNDLEGARTFFETYFGAAPNNLYHNPKSGFSSYFLSFPDGGRLELMNHPAVSDLPKGQMNTGYTHIAFAVESREEVDELAARLKAGGYEILSGPRLAGPGCYECRVLGFEDNLVDIIF